MLRSITIIKSALPGRVTKTTWIGLSKVLVEGIVLMFNRWRCPLRIYAEKLGVSAGL